MENAKNEEQTEVQNGRETSKTSVHSEATSKAPENDRLYSTTTSMAHNFARAGGTISSFKTIPTWSNQRNMSIGRSIHSMFIPVGFFESRNEIRTWGAKDITDPSVQPYEKGNPSLPEPFHVSLPGYSEHLCEFVIQKFVKAPRDEFLGPDITISPPTWVPQWQSDPNFKPQAFGYNWRDNGSFKMDRLPYVNANFEPHSGEKTHMYNEAFPFTSYPYGVPRV